jgi:hypothetical protein
MTFTPCRVSNDLWLPTLAFYLELIGLAHDVHFMVARNGVSLLPTLYTPSSIPYVLAPSSLS